MISSSRSKPLRLALCAACLTLAALAFAWMAGPSRVQGEDPPDQSLAVTVYNGNLGLVKDTRRLTVEKGVNVLPFPGVAAHIDPTSVALKALDHAGVVDVLEQNYEYDLLTPEALLNKYVGEEVTLVFVRDEKEEAVRAKLLSTQGGTVYQIGDSIALNPPARVVLPALKGDLKAQPTLLWTLRSGRSGPESVEVSYLTGGLNWKADYVVTLDPQGTALDLGGWVTLENHSGAAYPNARLKLVAGDIHRAEVEGRSELAAKAALREAADATSPFVERSFFEYHLYDLERPTTLKNNQTKQIRLLSAEGVKTQKLFILAGAPWYYTQTYGGEKGLKVGVYQEFENRKQNGLGIPLPAGVLRLYQADMDGSLQLIGEDRIDHTPKDERVRVKVGEAFDVVAERRQTDFRVLVSGHLYESEFEVVLRNHKQEAVEVRVVEPLPSDWTMMSNTHEYEKLDAFTVQFKVPVPRDGEAVLKYRIQVKY